MDEAAFLLQQKQQTMYFYINSIRCTTLEQIKMKRLKRLSLYIKAYRDYKNGLGKDYQYLEDHNLECGFCRYFNKTHKIYIYWNVYFEELLPELYAQEPKNYELFWYTEGFIPPRLRCLKAAIILTLKFWK